MPESKSQIAAKPYTTCLPPRLSCSEPTDPMFQAGLLAYLHPRLFSFPVPQWIEQRCQAYSSGGCAGLRDLHVTGLPVSPLV